MYYDSGNVITIETYLADFVIINSIPVPHGNKFNSEKLIVSISLSLPVMLQSCLNNSLHIYFCGVPQDSILGPLFISALNNII